MKKIILLVLFFLNILYSVEIDEYKVDLYYANGIMMMEDEDMAREDWQEKVDDLLSSTPELFNRIGKTDVAYNISKGMAEDLFESFIQKTNLEPGTASTWYAFKTVIGKVPYIGTASTILFDAAEYSTKIIHDGTLNTQKASYKESIKSGHGVVVVAHSQGNLFTQEAYRDLVAESKDGWMGNYFHVVSVATPGSEIPNGGHGIIFDNDFITVIPNGMKSNITTNPNRRDVYVYNALNELIGTDRDVKSIQYHGFEYYMGYAVWEKMLDTTRPGEYVRSTKVKTDKAKTLIMGWVVDEIFAHNSRPSQWDIKKEIGCICKEKYVDMTHIYDSEKMDILLEDKKVKDFTSVGGGESKIYIVTLDGKEQYVKASFGGTNIEEISEDNSDLCYVLKDDVPTRLGEIRGIHVPNLKGQAGAMKMTLSWTYQCDVDMDLTMTGNDAVVYDIKDVEGAGKEHLVIPNLYDIKPGDYYVFNANGKQLPDSTVTEEMLAEDPIEVRALLETTKGDYFNVWPVESFASLDIGDFAKVNVYEEIQAEWVCPAINNVPDWEMPYNNDTGKFQCVYCTSPYSVVYSPPVFQNNIKIKSGNWYCNVPQPEYHFNGGGAVGGRTYNGCAENEKKSTCGCVPCDYIVTGLYKRIENGPIAGAKVEIIKAMDADAINPTVLYRGSTTDKEDIFQSGLLEIPDDAMAKFEDDAYYLVLAKGGKDIDRDDDMVRDSVPTDNNGTIHAIIKGSDLKKLPFRVNILTEAIYQVSGDSIGHNYDAVTLQEKLDDTAQKLINHKLYPGDDSNRINYKDVLLWTPAVDKKALYKPFTTYVEPIITSLYADKERFDESYRLIYEPYASSAPQLEPLALDIPEGLDNDSVIAQVKTGNKKVFDHVVLQGNFSEHFSIDNDGYIHIAQSKSIEDGNRYRLLMKAIDVAGREGSLVSLTIGVNSKITQSDTTMSKPRFISAETFDISENAPEGTVVAKTHFEDSNQTIVSYALSGQDSSMFMVDNQGIVRVAPNADIDYEKSKLYSFKVAAKNDVGNESFPVRLSVPIKNRLDTPLFDLVVFEHIEENIPLGTVITTIRTDRVGLGAIDKFEILSPHMPFTIDSNGTMYVSNYIDYEQKKQYDFYAIARTKYGNSNKIEIHIVVDDQRPEVGVPSLEALTLSVDENITSGSKIGQLVLDTGATAIERIALYGEDDNFRVDANGSIYLADNATLDYETKTRYDLGARALNSRGWGNEVHIVINVTDVVDDLPTFDNFIGRVDENSVPETVIGKINFMLEGVQSIKSFRLIGEGNENFTIDVNGTIRVSQTAQLDYENINNYLIQAIAISGNGFQVEIEVIINILNVPENPPVLKPLTLSIEENASIGTVVGTVQEDIGGDSPITTYRIDDNSTFSVDGNGTVSIITALDYETQIEYLLQVYASNGAGESEPINLRITIINIIDDEPNLEPANLSVEENSPVGTVVGKIDINSTGSSEITSIILEGTDFNVFSVDVNGTVRVAKDWLDYEYKRRYVLSAVANNSQFSSEPVEVVINIINVIDSPPIIHSHDMYVDENSAAGTVIGTLNIESETPLHSVILGSYDNRHFTIDLNGTIRVAEGAVLDYEYNRDHLISVTATNDDGGSTRYIYIILNDIPDPTINSFTGEVVENSPEGTVVGTVGIESPTPITNVYLTGTGSENFTIDLNGTIRVDVNAVLDYEQYSTYGTIIVHASNAYGTNRKYIRINIGDVPDSPPKIGYLNTTIQENTPAGTVVGTVTISRDTPVTAVTLSGTGHENFSIDMNGTIRVADGAVLDYEDSYSRYYHITVNASNQFGTASKNNVTISLSNVPDPTLYQTSFSVAENSVAGTVVGTARIDSDTPLTETYLTGVGSENFTIDLNGTIRVAEGAVLDYESSDRFNNIIMHVGNKYGINSTDVYIYVLNIPDTPPIVSTSCGDNFFVEDGQDSSKEVGPKRYCGYLSIYSDSTVDSVAVVGENASDFTIDTKGVISIAPGVVVDINRTKLYTFTVTASNSFGESSPVEITIEVHDKAYMSFNPEDNILTKDIKMVDMQKDGQGNTYILGTKQNNNSYSMPVVIKYNSIQNIEWIKDYHVTSGSSNWWNGVENLKLYIDNNRLYVVGDIYVAEINDGTSTENQNLGEKDIFAISLDTNGTSNWVKQFGTVGSDAFVGMLIKDNRLNIAVNTPEKYDVDNNTSTLSEGVIYILESNGSIQNVVQFDETQIDKIYAWNLSKDHKKFIVYSKIDSVNNIIQLDSQYSVKSSQIINGEFGSHTFVFDDVVYTVNSTYSTMQIIKYSSSEEEWRKEKAINGYLSNVQLYHDGTSIKILFNKGDFVYFYEYDLQGNQLVHKVYGIGNTEIKPFLIDGEVYLLENNKIVFVPT